MTKAAKKKRPVWTLESEAGYWSERIENACAGNRARLRVFAEWLGEERALGSGSITVRVRSACGSDPNADFFLFW